jgi:adenosylcobinamide-GDP ribazoletransferase
MSRSEVWWKWAGELAASFALLTRLPVGRFVPPDKTQAVWAYPIVGATVGLIGGVAYWLLFSLSCPPVLAALLAVATAVFVTGALHEDGLADMADGLGGGTPDKRLAIMRDARVGTYGVLALILSVGLRVGAIALMAKPTLVVAALVAAGAASRATAAVLMAALPHARGDGLSVAVGRPTRATAWLATVLAAIIGLLVLPVGPVFWLLVASGLAALAVGSLARNKLGGQTGDVLGASVQVSECASLVVLASLFG